MKKINFKKRRSFKFSIEFIYEPEGLAIGFELTPADKEFAIAFICFGIIIYKS